MLLFIHFERTVQGRPRRTTWKSPWARVRSGNPGPHGPQGPPECRRGQESVDYRLPLHLRHAELAVVGTEITDLIIEAAVRPQECRR